jgi:gluconokinase
MRCTHVIVMGVSGSGKTKVGQALAERLGFGFIEGDDHHPPENITKMAAAIPLTDEDRWPWLRALADLIAERHQRGESTVLACSGLRRAYRDVLRAAVPGGESFVIELDADRQVLSARMEARRGHYMPVSLLDSQLAALEPLQPDEAGVRVNAAPPLDVVVATALAGMRDRENR